MTDVMQRRVFTAARGRASGFQRLVCLLVLAAFAFQSYLVQVHIHNLPSSVAAARELSVSPPDDGKAAPDADKCLLCQEYVHAGAFLLPAAAAVLPPAMAVSLVRLAAVPAVTARSPSHIWISRAPPRA
jgi:hypothetical protein